VLKPFLSNALESEYDPTSRRIGSIIRESFSLLPQSSPRPGSMRNRSGIVGRTIEASRLPPNQNAQGKQRLLHCYSLVARIIRDDPCY
jgi:hypothetical protein